MAGVLTEQFGRQDIAFARGTTFAWDVAWNRSVDGGVTFNPVDLSSWVCRLLMYDQYDQTIYETQIDAGSDGLAHAVIPADVSSSDEWRAYTNGNWRVLATQASGNALSVFWDGLQDSSESVLTLVPNLDSGEVKLLGCGYWKAF